MRQYYKKIITLFLAVIITLGLVPVSAFKSEAATYSSISLIVPWYCQRRWGDCGISSVSMVEAYYKGYGSNNDAVYNAVWNANGQSIQLSSYAKLGYSLISNDLTSIYNYLKSGNPVIVYRTGSNHFSVIYGYNGSSTTLQMSGFLVLNTYHNASYTICGPSSESYMNLSTWIGGNTWSQTIVRTADKINIGGGSSTQVTVKSRTECKYKITVPANLLVPCYSTETGTTYNRQFSPKSEPFNVYSKKRIELSNGNIRYYFTDAEGNNLYLPYLSGMNVETLHDFSDGETFVEKEHPHAEYNVCKCGYKQLIRTETYESSCAICFKKNHPTLSFVTDDIYGVSVVDPPEPITKFYHTNAVLPTVNREGYILKGWSTERNGCGEFYAPGSKFLLLEDTVLYAVWEQSVFIISFFAEDVQDEDFTPIVNINNGDTVKMPYLTRYGYSFLGWSTTIDGMPEYYPGDEFIPQNDMYLFAVWAQQCVFLGFNTNGAEIGIDSIDSMTEIGIGEIITLPEVGKQNEEFVGWTVVGDQYNTVYFAGDTFVISDDVTFRALWKSEILRGDVNCDGVVNLRDVSTLIRYFAGWSVIIDRAASDYNSDGKVNSKDASSIIRYLVGYVNNGNKNIEDNVEECQEDLTDCVVE